jgi:uncharacterized protein YecE (DUF72 family)
MHTTPQDVLPKKRELEWYASFFNTLEVNGTL